MTHLWKLIRRHPIATVFIGFAGIAPMHAGFVEHMRSDPFVAKLFMVAVWCCGIPILLGLIAMFVPTRAPAPGRCPTCGYDLRATPERCPECGTEVRSKR